MSSGSSISYSDDFQADDNAVANIPEENKENFHSRKRFTMFKEEEVKRWTRSSFRRSLRSNSEIDLGPNTLQQEEPGEITTKRRKSRKSRALKDLNVDNSRSLTGTAGKLPPQKAKPKETFEIFGSDENKENNISQDGRVRTFEGSQRDLRLGVGPESPAHDRVSSIESASGTANRTETVSSAGRIDQQTHQLVQILPGIDAALLKSRCEELKAPLGDVIDSLLSEIEDPVPSREGCKKENTEEEYRRKFTVEKLLEIVPDPWSYFGDKNRDCRGYSDHSLYYLKTNFRTHYMQTINDAFIFHNQNLYLAYKYLAKKNRGMKFRRSLRSISECVGNRPNTVNPPFLLEVAFIENEEAVENHVKNEKLLKSFRLKDAKILGTVVGCQGCHAKDLLGEDVLQCVAGHTFCKGCIVRHIETGVASGVCNLKCLGRCRQKYSLKTIQDVVSPGVFTKLVEIYSVLESQEIPDLARCPFCYFVRIVPEEEEDLMCLNAKCLRELCRLFKESNRPRVAEGAKIEEADPRPESLGAASDGLIGTCWKCKREMVKEECCGGETCHACRRPVEDDSELEDGAKCPLYSTD